VRDLGFGTAHRACDDLEMTTADQDEPTQMAMPTITEMYTTAQSSLAELFRTLSDEEWATPVPCNPGWTVRDVLSHVAGVADDVCNDRTEGAPGEEWTASQVERGRALSVVELIDRWDGQAEAAGNTFEVAGDIRGPFDCHAHEHDVRQALNRPGNRETLIVEMAGSGLAHGFRTPFPMVIELNDGRVANGGIADGGAGVRLRDMSTFELFRSRLGRRSPAQVRAYNWEGSEENIETLIVGWSMFGPAEIDIVE